MVWNVGGPLSRQWRESGPPGARRRFVSPYPSLCDGGPPGAGDWRARHAMSRPEPGGAQAGASVYADGTDKKKNPRSSAS